MRTRTATTGLTLALLITSAMATPVTATSQDVERWGDGEECNGAEVRAFVTERNNWTTLDVDVPADLTYAIIQDGEVVQKTRAGGMADAPPESGQSASYTVVKAIEGKETSTVATITVANTQGDYTVDVECGGVDTVEVEPIPDLRDILFGNDSSNESPPEPSVTVEESRASIMHAISVLAVGPGFSVEELSDTTMINVYEDDENTAVL